MRLRDAAAAPPQRGAKISEAARIILLQARLSLSVIPASMGIQ
jgi:hypothetical protein